MEKATWKNGAIFPVNADVAAQAIIDLQTKLGKDNVTAQELLDASRDENAPLYSCFEWNDSVAAEQYRLWQARHIINSIEITYINNATPTVTRLFCNINQPRQQGEFVKVDVMLNNPNYRKQVLANALRELQSFQRKYAVYEELMDVCKVIDAFADTLK